MKPTIDHLPPLKQQELDRIAEIIRERCDDLDMILLFGSYARGDYKVAEDLAPDRKSGHVSDYDILAITTGPDSARDTTLWDDISQACNALKLSAHVRIIAHDIQDVNIKLAEAQYFFADITKEGCVLYSSGRVELAGPRALTVAEEQRIKQGHFDHWFERAKNFFWIYEQTLEKGILKEAAFSLNQATESCFKALLLVFTNYNPKEHRLDLLYQLAMEEEASIEGSFPRSNREERERFTLLDIAYIGARYDPRFRISREDLEVLGEDVKGLMGKTEVVCRRKIEGMG